MDSSDTVVAAAASIDVSWWREEFEVGFGRCAGRFFRRESRFAARSYVSALLSDIESRNCWWIAEQAGDRVPHRMQRLLSQMVWNEAGTREDVRGYVTETLGAGGVLILDDTGDAKKGASTVGAAR